MMKRTAILAATALLALSACASQDDDNANNADDFAARIKGDKTGQDAAAGEGAVAPKISPPRANAAPGPFAEGTATDPQSATCKANAMGPYLNRPADDETRKAIMEAAAGVRQVRFVTPEGQTVNPDPTHPRLNIMIDATGVIRDARCG